MNDSSDRERVLSFYRAFDNRDFDGAIAHLAPHLVAHMAGLDEPLTRDGFAAFGREFFNAFSGGKHEFDQVLVAGDSFGSLSSDRVITSGYFSATHRGSFQGLPPTGKSIRIAVMHIDRVENNQIVEHWGQGDAQGLMQQLGILFFPGPQLVTSALRYRWHR